MREVAKSAALSLLGPTFMHLRITAYSLSDLPLRAVWDVADDVSEAVRHAENLTMTLVNEVAR